MPFLSQGCVDHGGSSTDPSAVCCPGYTPWEYDAKNGTPYTGFMCWTATCADAGQWAGPNGVGNHCCTGLQNIGGICGTPTGGGTNTTVCAGIGKSPLLSQPCCSGLVLDATGICNTPPSGGGSFLDSIDPTTMLMIGGGLLVLLMMMKKR